VKKVIVLIITVIMLSGSIVPTNAKRTRTQKIAAYTKQAVKICNDKRVRYGRSSSCRKSVDCSSLVYFSLKKAHVSCGKTIFNTRTMGKILKRHGFRSIKASRIKKSSDLKKGDIIVNRGSHTIMYLGHNRWAEAKGSFLPKRKQVVAYKGRMSVIRYFKRYYRNSTVYRLK